MTIPQLALQAVASLGIQKPAGFDGTFATFYLLSPQDRIRVTNYSREYVKANPTVFTPETVAVAVQFDPISEDEIDETIDWGAFWEETAHNGETLILDPIVNVGETASLLAKAAPLILIVVGYILLKKKL